MNVGSNLEGVGACAALDTPVAAGAIFEVEGLELVGKVVEGWWKV